METEAFWSRLGRPATTEGYAFSPGESATGYDTGLAEWFRDAAHEVNMPADMAEALHDRFLETRMEEAAAHWQADQARGAETAATLGREWGGAYDANLDLARRAVAEVGGDDLKEALEVSGMGNDPTLIRAFAGIGRRLYGGGTATAGAPAAATQAPDSTVLPMPNSASAAQREILRLRTDEKFMSAYGDRTHPSHEIAQAEMDALYAAAYPPVRS